MRPTLGILFVATLWLAPCASAQAPPDALDVAKALQQATRDYNDGQLPRVVETLTTVIDALGADGATTQRDVLVQALFLRGRAHLLRSDPDAARADFRRVLVTDAAFTPDPAVSPRILQAFNEVRVATIGSLTLRVTPADARVELDGHPITAVGAPLAVTTGTHALSVTRPGYGTVAESLVVEPAVPLDRTIALERVSAVARIITSPADVEVLVNSVSRGRTTTGPLHEAWTKKVPTGRSPADFSAEFVLSDVQVGTLEVGFRKPCHVAIDERWSVAHLTDYSLDPVVLEKAVGTVRIDMPTGAAVAVDDMPRGAVPVTLELCAGEHRIDVRASGGRDIQTLDIGVKQDVALVPRLRPVIAILNVVRPQLDRGVGTTVVDAGPDRRVELERRLTSDRALLWAPPASQVTQARGATVQDGWLSYTIDREPDSDIAHGYSPAHLRELSTRIADALDVQAIAEMRLRSAINRSQNEYFLSILARGSTVPDVLEVDLGSGPSVSRAVAALNAVPDFYRASLGIVAADVLDLPGPIVARVLAGSAAASAGIAAGDIILRIDGQAVPDAASIARAIASRAPGDTLTVDYRDRNGAMKSAKLPVTRVPCVIATTDESWMPNVLVATLRSSLMSRPDPAVRLNLAVALMRLQNWEAALEELSKVDLPTTDGVSTGTVQFLMGECYAQLGVVGKAREAWTAAAATGHLLTQDGPPVRDLVPEKLAALDRSAAARPTSGSAPSMSGTAIGGQW